MTDGPFELTRFPVHLGLGATVQIHPVFTPDEVPRVVEIMEQATQKYS